MDDAASDAFSEACGLAGPLKVHVEGPGPQGRTSLEFARPYLVVGRDRHADLSIDSPDVSRPHAYFQVVGGRVFCFDLCSRTGVRWGGQVRQAGWVGRGERVEVGPARVGFEGDEVGRGGDLPISRSYDCASLTDARLEFFGDGLGREPWQVSRALVLIGRSPTCRVRLDGPGVGRIHAAVVRTPAGVWVVDLLGPGTLVGGTPRRSARLEDGDEIGLGGHRVRVRVGPGARPSGRTDLARRPAGRRGVPAPTRAGPGAAPASGGADGPRGRMEPGAPLDPTVARLLEEFDRMHRRTAEQSQQAILMMFRMHQDQMGVIHDQLSRLERLEDEQKALQAELARGGLTRPPRPALRMVSGGPAPWPARTPPGPEGGSGWEPPVAPAPDARAPGHVGPPPPGREGAGGHPSVPDPDAHARLSRRLAEIRDESQGLWKRLLGSLTGGGPDRGLP